MSSHERHFDLINEGRDDLKRAYVDMLRRLNESIAAELRRSRGLSKGTDPRLVLRAQTRSPSTSGHGQVLLKGLATSKVKEEGKFSKDPRYIFDPSISRWKRATPEQEKEKRRKLAEAGETPVEVAEEEDDPIHRKTPEQEAEGQQQSLDEAIKNAGWFKDENGNVRLGFAPSGNFQEPLSQEEVATLYRDISFVAAQLDRQQLYELASHHLGVDPSIIDTFVDTSVNAATWGVSFEEAFLEQYAKGEMETLAEEQGFELDEGEEAPDEVLARGEELYNNMFQLFWDLTKDDKWAEVSKNAYRRKRQLAKSTLKKAESQSGIVAGHLDSFLEGDDANGSIKLYGLLHDIGTFTMPKNVTQAERHTLYGEKPDALVGFLMTDPDAFNTLRQQADGLNVEQQFALTAMSFMLDLHNARKLDPDLNSADRTAQWWEERLEEVDPVFEDLKNWFAANDTTYTEDEWGDVQNRVVELARATSNLIDDYHHKRSGGIAIRAIRDGSAKPIDLFRNPDIAAEIQERIENHRTRVEAAIRAQETGHDHEVGAHISAAIKKKTGNDKADLLSYQRSAVAWMEAIESGILAYDAGLGKTPITIAYVDNMIKKGKANRGVVVVPGTLVDQWPSEIEEFRPGSKVVTISATDSLEDRILKLRAINSGEIKADFVIMTTGVFKQSEDPEIYRAQYHKFLASRPADTKAVTYNDWLQESGVLENDPLIKELNSLEGAWAVDEVHMGGFKSPATETHQIAQSVLGSKRYKFGLTATPITQGVDDLFHLSNLFHPGSAGDSITRFQNDLIKFDRTVDPETNMVKKVPVSIHRELLRQAKEDIKPYVYMKRKTMKSVSDEMEAKGMKLPSIQATAHPVKFEDEAQRIYTDTDIGDTNYDPIGGLPEDYETDEAMVERLLEEGKGDAVVNMVLRIRAYIRKQKCAISPKLVNKDYDGPEPKLDAVTNIVSRHFSDPDNHDSPVVIFGSYHDSFKLLENHLVANGMPRDSIGRITGKETQIHRSMVQDAANAGKVKVVIVGIKAGGAGINLQKKANRTIFLDKPWTPSDMEQAIGRIWRTGQENQVNVHHIKVHGTTDERKLEKLEDRSDVIQSLSFADLDDDALAGKIAEAQQNLVGSFDSDVTEWTPEQEQEALRMAGLGKHDVVPLHSIEALKSGFKKDAFVAQRRAKKYRETGDIKIKDKMQLNDLRLKKKMISKKEHAKRKQRLTNAAQRWIEVTKQASDITVAAHFGEDFEWQSDGMASVKAKAGTGTRKRNSEQARGRSGHAVEGNPYASLADPKKGAKLKVTPSSQLQWKPRAVKKGDLEGFDSHFHTAMSRVKPTSHRDIEKALAQYIYDFNRANTDEKTTKKAARERAENYLKDGKLIKRFVKLGVIQVLS